MGEQSDLQSESAQSPSGGKASPEWTKQIDAELAFRLVDSILPFEACLYHQILPLSLEGSRLKLGMVNLDDTAAIDYVRRILAYMNCSLVPQPLASDIHYAALSAYLNYADQQRQSPQPVARRIAKKLAEQSSKRSLEANRSADLHSNPTLVVDSPTVLPAMPIEEEIGAHPNDLTVAELPPELPTDQPKPLLIHPKYLADPPETLIYLPPAPLLEELLGRVLLGGIGRLHLECTAEQGRILWSQNGILQAILENLPLTTFAGVIQELKLLTQLPLKPIQKPKQVEIDRTYQNQRLLFRLRLMLNKQGQEEATLQILRGAALRFYRQQQMVAVGQEALSLAQQLQQKMSDVYRYSRAHGVEMPAHLSILPELDRTLKRISYQLNDVQSLKFPELDDEG